MRNWLGAFAVLVPTMAQAACPVETFLSCPIADGRQIEVCIQPGSFTGDGSFSYTFGAAGAPELSLSVPMSAGTVTPWPGVGRAIWASVGFPSGDYEYEVWHSFDRLDEEAGLEAGVTVMQDGKFVADFACTGGEISPLFTLEDTMAAAGYCWNTRDFHWQRDDCG